MSLEAWTVRWPLHDWVVQRPGVELSTEGNMMLVLLFLHYNYFKVI